MTAAISSTDVLCGRGGATNNHPGNKRFRAIVAEHMEEYLAARKKEKATIARLVVNEIKRDGGRFLKRSSDSDAWVEIPEKLAISKTSQALREGLDVRHKTYRQQKMPRRGSDSSEENPRKRTRVVKGTVLDSPTLSGSSGNRGSISPAWQGFSSIPELKSEDSYNEQSSQIDPLLVYFEPPRLAKSDGEDVAAV